MAREHTKLLRQGKKNQRAIRELMKKRGYKPGAYKKLIKGTAKKKTKTKRKYA